MDEVGGAMIHETFPGWVLVAKEPDGSEVISIWDYHSTKEDSTHAENMLKSRQEACPDTEFRLVNVTIEIKEV